MLATMDLVQVSKEIGWLQGEWDEIGAWGRALRIRAIMGTFDSTPTELADRMGVSQQTVSAWIHGDKDADWGRWMAITKAFGVDEGWKPPESQATAAEARLDEARPALRAAPRLPVRKKEKKKPSAGPPRRRGAKAS